MTLKERRKFMRIATENLQADYWAKGPSMMTGQAQVRDFCREGLRIALQDPVHQGEHVDLTFKVPGDNVPIFATAEVAWAEVAKDPPGTGAGLKFISIKALDLARLLDFVYSQWLGGIRKSFSK